jgi:Putative auto-transporter adhesin, head GIN domain
MKNIFKTVILAASGLLSGLAQAQESIPLSTFGKIVASPRVNVILEKGDRESIRIVYNDIPKNKVNVIVKNNKLRIYLDHAKVTERQVRISENGNTWKHGIYSGSSITAFVTYKELKSIQMRGEQELRCDTELKADKFKLKAYGETEIRLASLTANKFKASLYGENDLKIKSGTTSRQLYRLFGENKIDTRGLKSEVASTHIYGEGRISVNASDEVHISAFGEPTINIEGTSIVSKGIILGHASINVNR